ncbi:MAG TPA: hypothetical protein PKK23_08575 [Nitrospirales bacterium]|nr:hypothetical protein [Nitrospiraceae bacterium]HNP29084.1 hypothetical protein [Nitrospirales bacterium]
MGIFSTVKHEIKEVVVLTLYIFVWLGVFLIFKKVMLATYEIEFYAFSTGVVGALVVGMIVVVLDKTRVGSRLEANFLIGAAALCQTIIYSLFTFLVLLAEKMFGAYWENGAPGEAFMEIWIPKDGNVILAKTLCIGLAFMGYPLYRGIDRGLGDRALKRLVFSSP